MRRFAIIFFSLVILQQTQAQDVLQPFAIVEQALAVGETESYTFTAREGSILSFLAQSTDGTLDPQITLIAPNGDVLLTNDDYDYPDRTDALIEGFTVPRTGQYAVSVSGVAETAGTFRLEMAEGFPTVVMTDTFATSTDVTSLASAPTIISQADGALHLSVEGIEQTGVGVHPRAQGDDFYTAVTVKNITHRNGWLVGLVLRKQSDDNYYLLQVENRGIWRFLLVQDGITTVVRDWTDHPALVAEQTTFRLSVFANGGGFDAFYDGQYIGTAVDSTITGDGSLGFVVGTQNAFDSNATATFDDFIVTVPTQKDGQRLQPTQILGGTGNVVARQLQHMSVIPIGGEVALDISETTATYNGAGTNLVSLARGSTFTNFVYSTQVSVSTSRQGIGGCGIVARQDGDNYVLAYADNVGGYGLSQRVGAEFLQSNFNQYATPTVQVWLLMIGRSEDVLLYVDGKYFATITASEIAGNIGNAVVNFDAQETACRFRNVWLWRWN